jgi:predicted TPR repeat methyltransferase
MIMATLDDLRADINELARLGVTEAYRAKQLHKIPQAPVVDRIHYIVERCQGKRVLHLGCGWPPGVLHQAIERVASVVDGIDIEVPDSTHAEVNADGHVFWQMDLDALHGQYPPKFYDIVVAAEILEHLGNPGLLLQGIRAWHKDHPVLITVPNANSRVGRHHLSGGIENVHIQHTAWYSYRTLRTLVERYGYEVVEWAWYNCPQNAQPQESEGLCMLVK